MERESFEDQEVAALLNKSFISIKVDREERPDIDSIYMEICQAMTGSGGWPLTIIMTPDKKPFFTGTYFSKNKKYGRLGLMELLPEIANAWENRREDLNNTAESIVNIINRKTKKIEDIGMDTVDRAFEELKAMFDPRYGGFGSAPKFPTPHNILFLLRYASVKDNKDALRMAEATLKSMYLGGIFDHIGYGFSRYSTDRRWLVPHFEKMLYDNALLAYVYTEAYSSTKNKLYMEISKKIFDYVLRDMTSSEGGFYSAEDADSEGVEGKYYLWSPDEVVNILGKEDGKLFCEKYDISENGNFEGENIPNLINTGIEIDSDLNVYVDGLRRKLLNEREKRVHPYKDDKILTSWNGLMIASLSFGGRIFNEQKYITAAENAADFISKKLTSKNGRLMARYRDGETAFLGYLDDYSFYIWGLIELYRSTFDPEYLKSALKLNGEMIRLFKDNDNGGLFLYGVDSEEMISRPKESYDGAMPSGNSVAAMNMLRLSRLSGNGDLMDECQKLFDTFSGDIKSGPNYHTFMVNALLYMLMPSYDIVISGILKKDDTQKMLNELNNRYIPYSTLLLNTMDDQLLNINNDLKEKVMLDGKATAYVCKGYSCSRPVNDSTELSEMLR